MCTTSMIMDYGRQQYYKYYKDIPIQTFDNDKYLIWVEAFQKLVEQAEEFDKVTGQPDCVDPEKAELMQKITDLEARIKELECR